MEGLLQLEGATVSSYEGTRVDFEVTRRNLILWGDEERGARFFGQGMQLSADTSIVYDDLLGVIRTRGAAEFIPENGAPVATQRLVYSLREDRGTALEAETDYGEGGVSWIVRGDLDSVRDGELFASSTIFTSCDLDHPHSYFKADRIKILTPDTWRDVQKVIALRGKGELLLGYWHLHPWFCRPCPMESRERCAFRLPFYSREDCELHAACFPRAWSLGLLVSDHGTETPSVTLYGWRDGVIVERGFHVVQSDEDATAHCGEPQHAVALPGPRPTAAPRRPKQAARPENGGRMTHGS
jgi:hypothetical protein